MEDEGNLAMFHVNSEKSGKHGKLATHIPHKTYHINTPNSEPIMDLRTWTGPQAPKKRRRTVAVGLRTEKKHEERNPLTHGKRYQPKVFDLGGFIVLIEAGAVFMLNRPKPARTTLPASPLLSAFWERGPVVRPVFGWPTQPISGKASAQ